MNALGDEYITNGKTECGPTDGSNNQTTAIEQTNVHDHMHRTENCSFFDASSYLIKSICLSVHCLVHLLVSPSFGPCVAPLRLFRHHANDALSCLIGLHFNFLLEKTFDFIFFFQKETQFSPQPRYRLKRNFALTNN